MFHDIVLVAGRVPGRVLYVSLRLHDVTGASCLLFLSLTPLQDGCAAEGHVPLKWMSAGTCLTWGDGLTLYLVFNVRVCPHQATRALLRPLGGRPCSSRLWRAAAAWSSPVLFGHVDVFPCTNSVKEGKAQWLITRSCSSVGQWAMEVNVNM